MCPQGSGGELTGKRQKGMFRDVNEMFYILFWEVVTQMDATVKIHQNQHPRSVHFYGTFRKFERSVKKEFKSST